MSCRRCPHHVRHGLVSQDTKAITFQDRCGLKMKDKVECGHYPFPPVFEYTGCEVYRSTFKSNGLRNDVQPTKDFQYSEAFTSNAVSITEMELL
jgi:hypothetical protein